MKLTKTRLTGIIGGIALIGAALTQYKEGPRWLVMLGLILAGLAKLVMGFLVKSGDSGWSENDIVGVFTKMLADPDTAKKVVSIMARQTEAVTEPTRRADSNPTKPD